MISIMKKKLSFENFMSGVPALDYIHQGAPYEEQIRKAAEMIKAAEYVLIGSGSGMSLAAGAEYGGEAFRKNFGEFRDIYGKDNPYMQDTYSAGFYPFPDEEAFWGMWSRLALYGGADLDVTPLHKTMLEAVSDKEKFLLTTNVDHQFEKAGFPAEKIFATQGSYNRIQCKRGCHPKTYDAVAQFRLMDQERKNGRIPSHMVPKCPVCGGAMAMNLRADSHFVQDEAWYEAESCFSEFLYRAVGKKLVLIELGVGFNTPAIIRFPFEKLCREHKNTGLIRLNYDQAAVPESLGERAVGIDCDMSKSITDLAEAGKTILH